MTRRAPLAWGVLAAALALTASACTSSTSLGAAAHPSAGSAGGKSGAGASPSPTAAVPACNPAAVSLPPTGSDADGADVRAIKARGKLIVGVSPDEYLTGYLNGSGEEVGFDIDIARQVEKALFGTTDDAHIEFKVLSLDQRITDLQNGGVDIVVETFTITCARAQEVGFSSVYYEAQQRLLVEADSGVRSLAGLTPSNQVCAQTGSTNAAAILAANPHPQLVQELNLTTCLVDLQQGRVQAISTDDVILAGLASQDPTTVVVGPSIASEPYGIAVPLKATDLERFVNGVLAEIDSDGTWESIYAKWLQSSLGAAQPPTAQYAG